MHRRAGKTELAVNLLIKRALSRPNQQFAYIAPTYQQVKKIAWERLKHYSRSVRGHECLEGEMSVTFPNGSKISLFGAHKPDRFRGLGFDGMVLDETQDLPPILWYEVILPTLADRGGDWFVMILGTPKGRNLFFDLYQEGLKDEKGWWTTTFKTVADTGFEASVDFQILSATMSEEKKQQEWYCSFEAGNIGSYYQRYIQEARQTKRIIPEVVYNPAFPVYTSWDIGIADLTCIWYWQKIGGKFHFIDYEQGNNKSLKDWIDIVKKKKYYGNYGAHYAPHDMQHRDFTIGVSRSMFALQHGVNFTITPMLSVEDGIEAARVLLPHCYFNSQTCDLGIIALENYASKVDSRTGKAVDTPNHDASSHGADSFRYAAINMIKLPGGFSQNSLFGSK